MKQRSIRFNYFLNVSRIGFGILVGLLTMPYVNRTIGVEGLGKIEYINSYNHIELNLLQSVYKVLSTFDINSPEFNQMKFEDLVRIDLQKRLNALDDKMFILDKVEVNIIKKQNMETK